MKKMLFTLGILLGVSTNQAILIKLPRAQILERALEIHGFDDRCDLIATLSLNLSDRILEHSEVWLIVRSALEHCLSINQGIARNPEDNYRFWHSHTRIVTRMQELFDVIFSLAVTVPGNSPVPQIFWGNARSWV